MSAHLLKKFLLLIPTFIGITVISFGVMHLAPGKPTDAMTELNAKISMKAKAQLIELYGLNKPVHQQYWDWMTRTLKGDFGRSFKDGRPVLSKITERIPITLTINIISMLLVFLISIPIAVVSATKANTSIDHGLTLFVFAGFALPSFWVALLCLECFGVKLGWFPVSGLNSLGAEQLNTVAWLGDRAYHLILPIGIMVFGSLAGISRYIRLNLIDVLGEEYIKLARAKGLPERLVLYRHALRNALLPIITILGLSIPGLLGGSVIMETIFAIPGMGRLFFDATLSRDYPVVMGLLVFGAVLTLLGNFIADTAYAFADPRIRVGGEGK